MSTVVAAGCAAGAAYWIQGDFGGEWGRSAAVFFFGWMIMFLGVFDQIERNKSNPEVARQLSFWVWYLNIGQNIAWIFFSWFAADVVGVVARFASYPADHIVLFQMGRSRKKEWGAIRVFTVFLGVPVLLSLTSLTLPYYAPGTLSTAKQGDPFWWAVLAVAFTGSGTWVVQIFKNFKNGAEASLRNFSFGMPLLVVVCNAAWLVYDPDGRKSAAAILINMSFAVLVHSTLVLQGCYFRYVVWRAARQNVRD